MQILHFDWLCYYGSISNSHRVAKFAGLVNLFIFFAEFIIGFFCLTTGLIVNYHSMHSFLPFHWPRAHYMTCK